MKSELVRLGRNTAIYGAGNVLLRTISLLLLPVFTSYLTPLDYGISSILGVLSFFLTPVFALGLTGALGVVYFESNEPGRRAGTIWTAVVILAMSATALVVIGLAFGSEIANVLFAETTAPYDLGYLVAVSLAAAALSIVSQPLLLHLQFEERAKTFVLITAGSTAMSIALSVLFIVILGRGVAGFVEAGFFAQATTLLASSLIVARHLPLSVRLPLGMEALRLGVPIIPSFIAVFVMQQANKLILQDVSGLSAVGIYTIGFNIGLVATVAVSGFTSAWFPFFSSYMTRREDAPPVFARVMTYYVIAAGTLSLFFFAFARPVTLVLTQPDFHEAYVAIGLSAAAQALVGVHSILLASLYIAKDLRYGMMIQWAAAAASVGLNFLLIRMFDILGAALALALGFAIMAGLQHGWNRVRGYPAIPYDGKRIGAYGTFYILAGALFLVGRDWTLAAEIGAALVGSILIVAAGVASLTSSDRAEIVAIMKTIRGLRWNGGSARPVDG